MTDAVRLDRDRLALLMATEQRRFADAHPRSAALHESAKASLLDGVPMPWMIKWAGPFPPYVESSQGAQETVAALYDRLDRRADESKRRAGPEPTSAGGPLLLDAAFLVPRTRSKQFASTVVRETKALAATGYRVTMSGPWPPYSFVQD